MNCTFRGAIWGGFLGALIFVLVGLALGACSSNNLSTTQRALEPARATAFGWTVKL